MQTRFHLRVKIIQERQRVFWKINFIEVGMEDGVNRGLVT